MAGLMDVPGLRGYLQAQQIGERSQTNQLQQVGALQGILQKHQQAQEQQEAKALLMKIGQQAGGDPAKMLPMLMQAGPVGIKLAEGLKGLLPKPAEDRVIAPGGALVSPQGEVRYQAPFAPKEPKAPQMRTRIQGETQIQEEFDPENKTWKPIGQGPRFARSVPAAGGGGTTLHTKGELDPEAVTDLAIQSLYDPMSLAGYRRDPKMMSQIANQRVKLMKEGGVTSEDVVAGRAGFKADTASLNKITPQYDAITAFEKTAIRNGKILVELADKVDTTGVPVVERWIRLGRKAVGGDADVAKFDAQMNLYRAEAARILTQPNLSGVLTDTARKEMEEVIRGGASASQIKGVVNLLERDFNNRKETLEEQIGSIRSRMRSRASPGGTDAIAPTPSTPTVREFATEADAIKSGVKGKVKIGGRNATIE